MVINDKEYWNNYYDNLIKKNMCLDASPFARQLIEDKIISPIGSLFELGCGNGRDTVFFAEKGFSVTAVDQCENTTKLLNKFKKVHSFSSDFTNLPQLSQKVNVIYSRFTLHSISEEGEDRVLKWAYENLLNEGLFCIETRTIKDTLFGKGINKGNNVWFYDNHHRRFVNTKSFKNKLENNGFKIEFFKESNGFAKYKNVDPIVLRVILKKNDT